MSQHETKGAPLASYARSLDDESEVFSIIREGVEQAVLDIDDEGPCRHTSTEARRAAVRIMDALGIRCVVAEGHP